MAQIDVTDLTFYYEDSPDNIFEHVSFSVDTGWKLGLIGRNGKGKTTFLKLLLGKYEYAGTIHAPAVFDYFPYQIPEAYMEECAVDLSGRLKTNCELWKVICELDKLAVDAEVLYRPFCTLSHGERTKVMLAVLFSGENDFLLIDEPTNHLDMHSREIVKKYLAGKKGFILVSHDRDLLNACVDHVLVLNRCSIEVQNGNFSSWWENKVRKDTCSLAENEKHKKEIDKLKKAAKRAQQWAAANEQTKIGFDPRKEHDRSIATRAYIGAKTKKMQSRAKQMQRRMDQEIRQKEGLLADIERTAALKLTPLHHQKELLVYAKDFGLKYAGAETCVLEHVDIELRQGERLFLSGKNGCGKSSLMKAVLRSISHPHVFTEKDMDSQVVAEGILQSASGLIVSYVDQDTSFLCGGISEFCEKRRLDESLFCAVLRQLAMEREQFVKRMEAFSDGQKKKVLLAASLLTPAHLYVWDEPLNYIDVFSRVQIEELILEYQPTMLVVEHDIRFREKIATRVMELE